MRIIARESHYIAEKESVAMNSYRLFSCVVYLGLSVAAAESRFNRPVAKLKNPKSFMFVKLDDNYFPIVEKGPLQVTCMTSRDTHLYYVEIGVLNLSKMPITLAPDFVSFRKPGYTVMLADTLAAADWILENSSREFISTPPPSPTKSTTTYSGTSNTFGNATQINGSATTTVDNSAAGWHALGQAIAARSFYKAQSVNQSFGNYLRTFAHEKQEMVIQPGKTSVFVFTFQQLNQKKAPFSVSVSASGETVEFLYKE